METIQCLKCKDITDNYYPSKPTRCKPCQNSAMKEWRTKNRLKYNKYILTYVHNGPTGYNRKKWLSPELKDYHTKTMYKMRRNMIYTKPKKKIVKYLGCSNIAFRAYIETLWRPGMNWDNYGRGRNKWNFDHIKPLSSCRNKKELHARYHYTNVQPMWTIDNTKKGHEL